MSPERVNMTSLPFIKSARFKLIALMSGLILVHFAVLLLLEGDLLRRDVVNLLILLGGSFLLICLFSRHLTEPLAQLTQAVSQAAAGNLDSWTEIKTDRDDEVGILAREFNLLAGQISAVQRSNQQIVEQLRRSESFLHSILENLPDMIFLKEAGSLRFLYMNTAGEKMLGIPQKAFIGKSDYDFFPEEQAAFFVGRDRDTLNRGVLLDIPEEPIRTAQNTVRYLHTKKIPILDEGGRAAYLLGISRDITEQKDLERQVTEIRHKEQTRIAHDLHDGLGQTLTALALKAKLLENTIKKGNRPDLSEFDMIIQLANEASQHAREIARGLDPIPLNDGLPAALADLAETTHERFGLKCSFFGHPDLVVSDKLVATHFYRIAQEAVTNAICHGKAETIIIRLHPQQDDMILAISDDGVGMPPEAQAGSGMGIRNMRHRALQIGGTVEFRANEPRGTTVWCRRKGATAPPREQERP